MGWVMSNGDLFIESLKQTDQDIRDLRLEIHELRQDIAKLNEFRWRLLGMATMMPFIVTIGTTLLTNYFLRG